MKYAERYLQTAVIFIESYNGLAPLHHHLKAAFAADKKYGSKDRRSISHLCYSYFRLGHALKEISIAKRMIIVLFLSGADEWEVLFPPDWQSKTELPLEEKVGLVQEKHPSFSTKDIFPFEPLSAGMDALKFAASHLNQPLLFIRLRPGKRSEVLQKLAAANIAFEELEGDTLAFKNTTKLEEVLAVNKDYVVQDASSQRVRELMKLVTEKDLQVWDCCAASGGKAIMAYDLLPVKKLLATDVRQTIIQNLKRRFEEAGIANYDATVLDVTDAGKLESTLGQQKFDLVICDAPCSGSGTWGRTPEQLYYFTTDKISTYSNLQKTIAVNASSYVAEGGYLLYITCSVLQQENEEVVSEIVSRTGLKLVEKKLLQGYDHHADTMFAGIFLR